MENIIIPGFNGLILIKIVALVLMAMYLVFAFVVIRQVKLMTKTLQLGFETVAITLAYLHFAFAVLVFITALVIL
jgi:hypothetical protein